jgi:hypothetical protein
MPNIIAPFPYTHILTQYFTIAETKFNELIYPCVRDGMVLSWRLVHAGASAHAQRLLFCATRRNLLNNFCLLVSDMFSVVLQSFGDFDEVVGL